MYKILPSPALHRSTIPTGTLVLLASLLGLGFASPAAAQETSATASEVVTTVETMPHGEELGVCQGDAALTGMVACTYCNLDNCGCLVIERCTLVYSCTCSPIQCTRSCEYKFCVP